MRLSVSRRRKKTVTCSRSITVKDFATTRFAQSGGECLTHQFSENGIRARNQDKLNASLCTGDKYGRLPGWGRVWVMGVRQSGQFRRLLSRQWTKGRKQGSQNTCPQGTHDLGRHRSSRHTVHCNSAPMQRLSLLIFSWNAKLFKLYIDKKRDKGNFLG